MLSRSITSRFRCGTPASRPARIIRRQPTRLSANSWRSYHDRVIDHYENPRNVGSFDKKDPSVGTVDALITCFKNTRCLQDLTTCCRFDVQVQNLFHVNTRVV